MSAVIPDTVKFLTRSVCHCDVFLNTHISSMFEVDIAIFYRVKIKAFPVPEDCYLVTLTF